MTFVLVDTSVWVDHFRNKNEMLIALLLRDSAVIHPLIIGELACGTPPERRNTLRYLKGLGYVQQASLEETMDFVERESLFGLGCGLVDLLLVASTLITQNTRLWTLDKRLTGIAQRFGVNFQPVSNAWPPAGN